jgi:hypothetical protein
MVTRSTPGREVPPPPSAASISAALAALGAYATVPGADELDRQAEAVGGEHVLAAVLANALYGAAIAVGMLAEGHMLEAGAGAREMTLARDQVLKASGAEGPGVLGVMHWQAAQIATPLRAWARDGELGPMGGAARAAAWALTLILEACTVSDVEDERFTQLAGMLTEAREYLTIAHDHLQGIHDLAASLAGGFSRTAEDC